MPLRVAVTGGIGAGKSTLSALLAGFGALLVSSDELARDVVAPGTPGLAAVAAEFGPGIVHHDALDRPALAALVFADAAARRRLEGIVHPLVRQRFEEIAAAVAADQVLVNDIPLLVRLDQTAEYHLAVGVRAEPQVRVQRLIGRGLSASDARARLSAQVSDAEREPLCDEWISNDGGPEALADAAEQLWRRRLVPFAAHLQAGTGAPGRPARLVPADPRWPAAARRLAARVGRATGGLRVDHIGPTAVPGLAAEDVLDLQLAVPDLATADRLAPALAAAGFPAGPRKADTPHPAGRSADGRHERVHLAADPDRPVHLHVRVQGAPDWTWALLFRDWLSAVPAIAAEYLAVEQEAARRSGGDRMTRAAAEQPWIEGAHPRGLTWAARTGWAPPVPAA